MKKQYQKPEIEIIDLITEVIATEDEEFEGPTTSTSEISYSQFLNKIQITFLFFYKNFSYFYKIYNQ